jgi:osmotically-inducible protein OsmY
MSPEGIVELNGSAPSAESSRLAANLMRFQPGVRKVDNRLTVAK